MMTAHEWTAADLASWLDSDEAQGLKDVWRRDVSAREILLAAALNQLVTTVLTYTTAPIPAYLDAECINSLHMLALCNDDYDYDYDEDGDHHDYDHDHA